MRGVVHVHGFAADPIQHRYAIAAGVYVQRSVVFSSRRELAGHGAWHVAAEGNLRVGHRVADRIAQLHHQRLEVSDAAWIFDLLRGVRWLSPPVIVRV